MEKLILTLVLIAFATVVLGSGPARGLRRASRVIGLIGFTVFGLITLACLYGMATLGGRGGGVLVFFAIPSGIIAGLFLHAYSGSRATEAFITRPPAEQQARTREQMSSEIVALERRIVTAEARLERIWIGEKRRQQLRREAANAREQLDGMRRIEQGLSNPESRGR